MIHENYKINFFFQLKSQGFFRNYSIDLRNVTIVLLVMEFIICVDMVFGNFMITLFGVNFDSVPLDDKFLLITIAVPISYNTLIIILLMNVFCRMCSITNLVEIHKVCGLNDYNLKKRIKLTMKLLDKMNDTIFSINTSYIINIILSILNVTMTMIFMTFLGFDFITNDLDISNGILVAGGYSYSLLVGFGCVVIIYYSSSIKITHYTVLNNLTEIHLRFNDRKVHRQIHLAALQITHFCKKISCGLFELDWKCILVIIASVFNYIIVMIQFDIMISK